jgi:hypothetical protein
MKAIHIFLDILRHETDVGKFASGNGGFYNCLEKGYYATTERMPQFLKIEIVLPPDDDSL